MDKTSEFNHGSTERLPALFDQKPNMAPKKIFHKEQRVYLPGKNGFTDNFDS